MNSKFDQLFRSLNVIECTLGCQYICYKVTPLENHCPKAKFLLTLQYFRHVADNKVFLFPNLRIFIINKTSYSEKFESADFKYDNSFSKLQLFKITTFKSSQKREFWSQFLIFFTFLFFGFCILTNLRVLISKKEKKQ